MAEQITTVADLDAMSPEERHANFEASVVTDLSTLPEGYLDRVRARFEAKLVRREMPNAS
jgi:hypothetical protein